MRASTANPPAPSRAGLPRERPQPSDHHRGDEDGLSVTLFGDYASPATSLAHRCVEQLERAGVGFCFAFKHFPLAELHPYSMRAAVAAEAAAAQGCFWAMHELLLGRAVLSETAIVRCARDLGIDLAAFAAARRDTWTLACVREDMRLGRSAGVREAPALFLQGRRHHGRGAAELYRALVAAGCGRADPLGSPEVATAAPPPPRDRRAAMRAGA